MADTLPVHDRPLRELRGVVERITFQNAENGFTVARLAPERPEAEAEAARGEDRLVTVVGFLMVCPTYCARRIWPPTLTISPLARSASIAAQILLVTR